MAGSKRLISAQTLASSASSVTFSSIPDTYTDLVLKISARSDRSGNNAYLGITFNGSTSGYTDTNLQLSTGGPSSSRYTGNAKSYVYYGATGSGATSNTFSNTEIVIPNYLTPNTKPFASHAASENNTSSAQMSVTASLWSNTSAITSIDIVEVGGNNFVSGSTFYLYGISRLNESSVPGAPTSVTATGGSASASVAFTAPSGSAVDSYKVTSSPGSITAYGYTSPITVPGLTPGTSYTFTVTGINNKGAGTASSASNSVTPTAPSFSTTFSYTGADQTWTVPTGVTSVKIKCWGAGGGSGLGYGGPGGYSYGELSVTPGTTYTVVVGQGGVLMAQEEGPGTVGYGGGGQSSSKGYAGKGGGLAGVFTGSGGITFTSSTDRQRAVIIAGGSGGGGWTQSGSGGGGSTGQDGGGNYGGTGGTQSAPGGNAYSGVSGNQMQGGGNTSAGDGGGAGGGGGGYYGGGSGWNGDSPTGNSCGGGGSGYIGGVTNGTTLLGSGNGAPPNSGDAKYVSPAGYAGVLNQTLSGLTAHQGGHGLVVIYNN